MPPSAAPPGFRLRPAQPADALCLGVLAMQVFLDTYATQGLRADLAREALDVYAPEAYARRLADAGVAVTLAERMDVLPSAAGARASAVPHLVGFVDVSRHSACPVPGVAGPEVLRLYVQAPFQRRGLGRALLAQAEAAARADGAAQLWLTAWVGNARALAVYPALGWHDVGRTDHTIDGQRYENRVFAKALTGTGGR